MDAHLVLKDNLNIQINTNNREFITAIDKHLTDFVKGYRWMPRYKSGVWNGQISLFNKQMKSFSYGLLFEVVRYIKHEWSDLDIVISNDVKELYKGIKLDDIEYDLNLIPYPYQNDCIKTLLQYSKGIVNVATAGGKSLIISYIIHILNKLYENKSLIVVPTKQLVTQFKSDMISYGMNSDIIGMVESTHKEFDKQIVISTWQSLQNRMDVLPMFDTIVCDEVHTASADKLSKILRESVNAKFRFGVTGTIPTNRLDKLNVLSYLGPIVKTYTGKDLADLGFVSKCVIRQVHMNYETSYKGDYNTIKDSIFNNVYRMGLIKHIISNTDNSILILIDKIQKEGEVLLEELSNIYKDKEIIFLSGRDKSSIRDEWRRKMNTNKNIICIATYPIFQQGINIPSLRTIILASSTKSYIRVIQSLGRVLRKHVSKMYGGAVLYDICDNVKYLKDHAKKRERHYIKEKHNVETYNLYEKDGVYQLEQ